MSDLEKTLSDVLNKTVGAIESKAPEAWRLMVEATRLDAAINLFTAAMWIVALCATAFWFRRLEVILTAQLKTEHEKKHSSEAFDWLETPFILGCVLGYVVPILIALVVATNNSENVGRLLRPDIYTAKDLVAKVRE